MIKVFIPGKQVLPIWRQFKVKNKFIWGYCEFFFEECNDYDYIVVNNSVEEAAEQIRNILSSESLKTKNMFNMVEKELKL